MTAPPTSTAELHARELSRKRLGLTLFSLGLGLGGILLVYGMILPPLRSSEPTERLAEMFFAAVLALPAAAVYLTVPRLLDRYDPEPWYALLSCLFWGAIAACGLSGLFTGLLRMAATRSFDEDIGLIVGVVVSAPLMEEFWKGLGVFGVFWFLKREFDGVVDGIMYAIFTAIGFAAMENVYFYSRAAIEGAEVLLETFELRGLQTPWLHPLFTSMFGIGLGLARETTSRFVKWAAPIAGYVLAVALHALWNGVATYEGFDGTPWVSVTLPLWFALVSAFLAAIVVLVVRRGRIIAKFLEDEVHMGTLTRQEVAWVVSPLGLVRARLRFGDSGVGFLRTAARLALSKWHVSRVAQTRFRTVSGDFIAPLRRKLGALREAMRQGGA